MLSVYDIISEVGISQQAVSKRLKNIQPVQGEYRGGRPVNFYKEEDIALIFPQLRYRAPKLFDEPIEKVIEVKKPNPCKNKHRILPEKLEKKLIDATYDRYLAQGDRRGLRMTCYTTIFDYWDEIIPHVINRKKPMTMEGFQHYWYNSVINRSDKVNDGIAKQENWVVRWEQKHTVNKANANKATADYETLKIMEGEKLIGQGFGAGSVWVIDGTQFDAWVDYKGKKRTFNYICIMDGVTKMPLYVQVLYNGETIKEVAAALWRCVNMYGVPPLGIVADNGRAFKSKDIQAMVRSWYTPEQLDNFKKCPFRREMFRTINGPQTDPIIYPLARAPRFVFKAPLERSFKELNRHQQERLAISYIGTRDSQYLTHELGTTPTVALKNALPLEDCWYDFMHTTYTDFINRRQPGSKNLGLLDKKYKLPPTILNAWLLYGGKFNIENGILEMSAAGMYELPKKALAYAHYAMSDKKHKVKCGDNWASIVHNGETCVYTSDDLGFRTAGKEVTVVQNLSNSRYCWLFNVKEMTKAEKEKAKSDNIIINQASLIEYIGEGRITTIDSLDQVAEVRQRLNQSRKQFKKDIQALDAERAADVKTINKASEKLNSIKYAEYEVIDSDIMQQTQAPRISPSAELLLNEGMISASETIEIIKQNHASASKKKITDISHLYKGF